MKSFHFWVNYLFKVKPAVKYLFWIYIYYSNPFKISSCIREHFITKLYVFYLMYSRIFFVL